MKKCLLFACAAALALIHNLHSETFDFDALTDSSIAIGPSKNADGSAIALSPENPHSGTQSLKCVYNIGPGNGYAEFVFNEKRIGPKVPAQGKYKISFWVRGDEAVKAGPVGLRLYDAKREIHQYMLPGLEPYLRSREWTQYETVLDLSSSEVHWGADSDGIVDTPAALFSLAINGGAEGDSGVLFFDDLTFEPVAD